MSVLGEFRRIGGITISGLERSEHVALQDLGSRLVPLREVRGEDLSAAASQVLRLVERTREALGERQDRVGEHLDAATEDLQAVCRIILGHG